MDLLEQQTVVEDLCKLVGVDSMTERRPIAFHHRRMVEFLRDLRSGKLTVVETEEFFS